MKNFTLSNLFISSIICLYSITLFGQQNYQTVANTNSEVSNYEKLKNLGYSEKEIFQDLGNANFLLEPDPKYEGMQLNRTYLGMRYKGGYSDHLPVYVDLSILD